MSGDGGDKWISRGNRRELCRTGVMTMVSETFECVRTGAVHDFITVDLIDWVVVVAETPEKELVMIRQFRHGSGRIELEVPGGCIDRRDSDPLEAAERELLEETGFAGENPHIIGKVCPNPAIQHNTCYVVKIDNVRRVSEPQLEDTEDIEHLVVPQSKVREFLRSGAISHGIVLNALFFYLLDQCC